MQLAYPISQSFHQTNVYPQYVVFGKVLLMLEKLYYKNTLSIKDKNKINIQGFTVKKVSDDFVTIVLKIIDKQDVNRSDFNSLNDWEKDLYNTLLYVSGLHKTNHYKSSSDTVDKLKKDSNWWKGRFVRVMTMTLYWKSFMTFFSKCQILVSSVNQEQGVLR